MILKYISKIELTEKERDALLLSAKVLDEICKESECPYCILSEFYNKEFDPMETPRRIYNKFMGES